MTPLNFVCNCRPPTPPRKLLAVFRKIRIEQIFARARIRDQFFARCRNADELRVFATHCRLLFAPARAANSSAKMRFRSRESARSNGFTKAKFFCGEPPERALGRAFRGANRTNRCRRFASAAASEAFAAPRSARVREIFRDGASAFNAVRGEILRARRRWRPRSNTETRLEEIVDRLRIGFAAGSFHHLADEPADRFRVALGVADFVRILRDNVVDELFQRRNIGDLL